MLIKLFAIDLSWVGGKFYLLGDWRSCVIVINRLSITLLFFINRLSGGVMFDSLYLSNPKNDFFKSFFIFQY